MYYFNAPKLSPAYDEADRAAIDQENEEPGKTFLSLMNYVRPIAVAAGDGAPIDEACRKFRETHDADTCD